jgi:choline dehydrogenase
MDSVAPQKWDEMKCRWSTAKLKVYGVDRLRIADASILPRVTTGNTMAPCVVIGERAGEMLKHNHKI